MATTSSVNMWIDAARAGDEAALEKLWNRFSKQMTRLANRWIQQLAERGAFDEEDIAISAFDAFRVAIAEGRYPALRGVDELWRLLAVITVRKASDHIEAEQAQKRGGGQVQSLDDSKAVGGGQHASPEPSPELAAMMTEECRRLLELLDDPELEAVVLWKLQGYTNDEIAQHMNYSRRTIQRMISLIKARWEHEVTPE